MARREEVGDGKGDWDKRRNMEEGRKCRNDKGDKRKERPEREVCNEIMRKNETREGGMTKVNMKTRPMKEEEIERKGQREEGKREDRKQKKLRERRGRNERAMG